LQRIYGVLNRKRDYKLLFKGWAKLGGGGYHHGPPDPPEEENESMMGKLELMNLGLKEEDVNAACEQSNSNFEEVIELLPSTTWDALNPHNQE